jgi:hypothetical protein
VFGQAANRIVGTIGIIGSLMRRDARPCGGPGMAHGFRLLATINSARSLLFIK